MPQISLQDKDRFETARNRLQEKLEGMSFLAHLEELRMRVIKSLLAVGIGFCACWWKHEAIYAWVQKPIMEALHRNGLEAKLVYLNPTEPFNMYLKMGMIAGLFVASPFVLYQVWAFVAPGLYRREKRYIVPFLFFDGAVILRRRLYRLPHCLSAGPRLSGGFRQTVPAHDHHR